MTLQPIERCLRDPLWWLALIAVVLLAYALLRIPDLGIDPTRGGVPIVYAVLPHNLGESPTAGLPFLLMGSYLLAVSWPALLLASSEPLRQDYFPTPHKLRELARRHGVGSLMLAGIILLALSPVLGLAIRGENLSRIVAISIGITLLAQTSWLTNLTLLLARSLGRRAIGVPLIWAAALGLTWAVVIGALAESSDGPTSLDLATGHASLATLLWALVLAIDLPDARADMSRATIALPDLTPPSTGVPE